MGKLLIIFILIVFANCSQEQDVLVTKKVYVDVSKNAIFDAAKTLFNISNESNKDKSFIINSYRDKLEVNKIIFKENIIKIDIVEDKWLLELYQMGNETRANLILIRRDGLDKEDIEDVDVSVHELFWDRLDYLLGLKEDWKVCASYFNFIPYNSFCTNYFINSTPDEEYIQKDITISGSNIKVNTINTLNSNILEQDNQRISKSNKNIIFNQSENIEDTSILSPVMSNEIFKVEAPKEEVTKKPQDNKDEKVGIEDLKEGELLDINKQMNKFKKDLENIINTKPQFEDTDSNKIISNSDNLKENSEFDLKSKEKSK
jgi:hypothetical protein